MPELKVGIWNIQNYGQSRPQWDGRGSNYGQSRPQWDGRGSNSLRNTFICDFVYAHSLDVLIIMEAMPDKRPALRDLATRLYIRSPIGRRDWAYAYCDSAIASDDVDTVTEAGDLTSKTGARSEGYAVLWRTERTHFEMIEGLYPIAGAKTTGSVSPLNINQLGRPAGNATIAGRLAYGATGGFTANAVYPFQRDARNTYSVMDHWPKLNYPATGKYDTRVPVWSKSRRPVYVVVRLKPGNMLCPIAAYHAPSARNLASTGALAAGLARELYVVDKANSERKPTPDVDPVRIAKGIFAGDFNLSVDGDKWPAEYANFVARLKEDYDGGAGASVAPAATAGDTARRTTVQIIDSIWNTEPIKSSNPDDYLRLKIDLGFYLGGPNVSAERVNLMAEILDTAKQIRYRTAMQEAAAHMKKLEKSVVGQARRRMTDHGPQYCLGVSKKTKQEVWSYAISTTGGPGILDWTKTRQQLAKGRPTEARVAAEYLHLFVSDHLPIVATLRF